MQRSDDSARRASVGRAVVERALRDKKTLLRKLVIGEVIGERVRPTLTPKPRED